MRSILSMGDLSPAELESLLKRAAHLKKEMKRGSQLDSLKGRVVGVLFEKPSTRTRTSFEVAAIRLGGNSLYLPSNELQLSRGEPVKDTARILGKYLDVIVCRVYLQDTLRQFKEFSGISIINGLSDIEHPTQVISDLLTIMEAKGRLKGVRFAFIGDGDNVCNSLLLGASMVGMDMVVGCPQGYEPNRDILKHARENAKRSGSSVRIVNDPKKAAAGADVLYTDVWVSMGEEKERNRRMRAFNGFQINSDLLKAAAKDAVVMHCLPAHRDLEITDEVIEGKQSIVWQQGENKLYGAAAALEFVVRS
ncbi:MAG: ornithine carbamoyltransferase [Thaumarchaeota archaeon]|nr:ornithine carbamoyltransferase [Nitrososphaerota archaeon]